MIAVPPLENDDPHSGHPETQLSPSLPRWYHWWWWSVLTMCLSRQTVDGVVSGTAERAYILQSRGLVQTAQLYPPGRYFVYTSQSGIHHVPTMLLPWFCVSSCCLSYGCLLLLVLVRRALRVLSGVSTDLCVLRCAGSRHGGHGILRDDHTYVLELETPARIEFMFTYPLFRFFSPEAPHVFVKRVYPEKHPTCP